MSYQAASSSKRKRKGYGASINGTRDSPLFQSFKDHSFVMDIRYNMFKLEVTSETKSYVVALAFDRTGSGRDVEIKKYMDPLRYNWKLGLRILNELKVYMILTDTTKIVKLVDIMLIFIFNSIKEESIKISNFQFRDIYLVYERSGNDLRYLLDNEQPLLEKNNQQWLLSQLLSAVSSLHSQKIIHRDLRPSNISVSLEKKILKLRGFGLSKGTETDDEEEFEYDGYLEYDEGRKQGDEITAIYSAPEMLLGYGHSTSVDIWAVGCIFAEILRGRNLPLFFLPSRTKPTKAKKLNVINNILVNKNATLNQLSSDLSAIDLLGRMLDFNPYTRISVEEAMKHSYFGVQIAEAKVEVSEDLEMDGESIRKMIKNETEEYEMEKSRKVRIRKMIWDKMEKSNIRKMIWNQMKTCRGCSFHTFPELNSTS